MDLLGVSWEFWGRLGGVLGRPVVVFFPSGGRLRGDVAYDSFGEPAWETFGVAWGPLGDFLGGLGRSWDLLGALGTFLGPSWGHLGAFLETFCGSLGSLGDVLGVSWGILWWFFFRLGAVLEAMWHMISFLR